MKKVLIKLLTALLTFACVMAVPIKSNAANSWITGNTGNGEYAFYGCQIVLDGSFDLRFYVELSDEIAKDSQLAARFQIGNNISIVKQDGKVNNVVYFTCELGASQVTETISADIYYGGEYHHLVDYSVYDYLMELVQNDRSLVENTALKNLTEALLNYSAYSQLYFNYNIDNLANAGLLSNPVKNVSDEYIKEAIDYSQTVTGSNPLLSYAGYSLICESDTLLRVYFAKKDNVSLQDIKNSFVIEMDGAIAPASAIKEQGNYILATFEQIPASQLDKLHTVKIGNGTDALTVECSAMGYIYQAMDSNDVELKNLCKALFVYSQAAKEYLSSQQGDSGFFVEGNIKYRTVGEELAVVGIVNPQIDVVIPEKVRNMIVTRIDDNAFANDTIMVTLNLPNSISVIGENAFGGCTSLRLIK